MTLPDSTVPRVEIAATRRNHFGRYLLLVLLIPLIAFISIFPIARSDFYIHTSRRNFWHAMEYQFAERPGQCEVVIYGDSTALMGADPAIIEARTGLSTCNFATTYLGLATTGNLALDRYLATHQPPRFIIIEVLAAHLRPPALDDESGIIDGFWIADRKLPPLAAAKLFLSHPRDSFYFASQLWKQLIGFTPSTRLDLSQQTFHRDTARLAAHKGFFAPQLPGGNTDCFYQFQAPVFSRRYVESYQRYARNGTKVILWPSPVRHCDKNLNAYRIGIAFLGLAQPQVLDDQSFVDAQHLSTMGTEENSDAIAQAILSAQNK